MPSGLSAGRRAYIAPASWKPFEACRPPPSTAGAWTYAAFCSSSSRARSRRIYVLRYRTAGRRETLFAVLVARLGARLAG